MHRVLSFQMMAGRGFGESSEFVTKRMCFSFIFFIGFLALLGGFLLGRISTERNLELCEEKRRNAIAKSVLEITTASQQQYNLLLEELEKSSFDKFHLTKMSEKDNTEHENVKTILSNFNLFHKVVKDGSNVVATLRGSQEADRWILLSVSGDGISVALHLAQIFAKFRVDHKWEPHRTIIFCFFDQSRDSCRDHFPEYLKSRIVAYLAVQGNAIQKNGCLVASGSDVVKSIVTQEVFAMKQSILAHDSEYRRVFESCKTGDDLQSQIFLPRLLSDIPHASISFTSSNSTYISPSYDVETTLYRKILGQIVARSIWKFSENVILHWDPKDFERDVKSSLKAINSSRFIEVKEKIRSTMELLINSVKDLTKPTSEVERPSSLASRIANDLMMDLDRALLCPDVVSRSKTDLALIPGLLGKSQETISSFLGNILKCYEDAFQVLKDR